MGHPLYALIENPQRFFMDYITYRTKLLVVMLRSTSLNQTTVERVTDLLHVRFISSVLEPTAINFFSDQVVSNPAASVHDPAIDQALRSVPADFGTGWVEQKLRGKWRYRVFPDFLIAEVKPGIELPKISAERVVADITGYFGE